MATSVTDTSQVPLPIVPVQGVHTTTLQGNALAQSNNVTITQLVQKANSTSASLGTFTSLGSQALGTVYQNSNSFPILVMVGAYQTGSTGGVLSPYIGASSSPATALAAQSTPAVPSNAYASVTFIVPSKWYYKIISDHLILNAWNIWNLG
jgi:hypothetical protein